MTFSQDATSSTVLIYIFHTTLLFSFTRPNLLFIYKFMVTMFFAISKMLDQYEYHL